MKGVIYGEHLADFVIKNLLFVFLFSLLSCGTTKAENITPNKLPRNSFIFIQKSLLLHQCGEYQCREQTLKSVASGFIVKITDDGAYGVTAGHVCEDRYPVLNPPIQTRSKITILTLMEKKYNAVVLTYEMKSDLCLLYIANLTEGIKPLNIAKSAPKPGEKVYNLAAPRGIFVANMVPIFEGRYNGTTKPYAFYSLPAAPGSSGSMIINNEGDVVGMVHSVYIRFPNIIISPTYEDLYNFVSYNINKYETYRSVMDELGLKNIFLQKF